MVTLEKILSSQRLAWEWMQNKSLFDLSDILPDDGVLLHPHDVINMDLDPVIVDPIPAHTRSISLRNIANRYYKKDPFDLLFAPLSEVKRVLDDWFTAADVSNFEHQELVWRLRADDPAKYPHAIDHLDRLRAMMNIIHYINLIDEVAYKGPKKNPESEKESKGKLRLFKEAVMAVFTNVKPTLPIMINWILCAIVYFIILNFVFIQRGPEGTYIFGFAMVGMLMGGLGVAVQAKLSHWVEWSNRLITIGTGLATSVIGAAFTLMCAISPDSQVTFGFLLLGEALTLPTIIGPLAGPVIMMEFSPDHDTGACLLLYPAAIIAFLIYHWFYNQSDKSSSVEFYKRCASEEEYRASMRGKGVEYKKWHQTSSYDIIQ